MENASLALLIAGGILLAILTITLLVYAVNNVSKMGNAKNDKEIAQDLSNWNAEWEAYNRTVLYGADVLSVWNKAEQNNAEYDNNEYKVNITVKDKEGKKISKDFFSEKDNRNAIFKCTEMSYNNKTGRVYTIIFEYVE